MAFATVASTLVSPVRPRDWDVRVLAKAKDFLTSGKRGMLLRLFESQHYLDSERVADALASLEESAQLYDASYFDRPADICSDFVFAYAVGKGDLTAAELWWERLQAGNSVEKDADYWKAQASLLCLRGEIKEARAAWDHGYALALQLPACGAYDFTRSSFERIRKILDATAPPPLECEAAA
jgi:hypothetical protein